MGLKRSYRVFRVGVISESDPPCLSMSVYVVDLQAMCPAGACLRIDHCGNSEQSISSPLR